MKKGRSPLTGVADPMCALALEACIPCFNLSRVPFPTFNSAVIQQKFN
jgi:hypothetical protein